MVHFSVIDKARKEGRSILTEFESKKILKEIGIPVVRARLSQTRKEAASMSQKLGFPVVLKIMSPDVIHKTGAGRVKLGLGNVTEIRKSFDEIMKSVKRKYLAAVIHGVSVQKMVSSGTEVIVGTSEDP